MTIELLFCMECLNPNNCFLGFNKQDLIPFTQLFPSEFSQVYLMALGNQLGIYISDMCSSNDFTNLKEIESLTKKLVETKKHVVYLLVYLLIKVTFVLPLLLRLCREYFLQ